MRKPAAVMGAGLILACSVLAGCSAVIPGSSVPADTDGPRPVPALALHAVLLSAATVNDIMGASDMTVKDSRSRLFDGGSQFTDGECMVAWTPAEQTVYAHTSWTGVAAQTLLETPGRSDYFVIQAAISFPSRRYADDFFDRTAQRWIPCGDRTFVTKRSGRESDASWTFDAVSNADSTLWMTQRQGDSAGWSCQRALRVSNNIAIDVLACKQYASDEAITIAHGIDERLPSV